MARRFSTAEVVKALGKIGIVPVRQRGSHIQLRGVYRGVRYAVTVPADRVQINPPTLKSILRQASLTRDRLEELLNS